MLSSESSLASIPRAPSGVKIPNEDMTSRARHEMSLSWAMLELSRRKGAPLDRLMVHEAVQSAVADNLVAGADGNPLNVLAVVADRLDVPSLKVIAEVDPASLPALAFLEQVGWVIAHTINARGEVIFQSQAGAHQLSGDLMLPFYLMEFEKSAVNGPRKRPVVQMFVSQFMKYRRSFVEAAFATTLVNFLSIIISMYTMQVYDRVIPTQGYSTLFVLTSGVFMVMVLELAVKLARTRLMEAATIEIDKYLTRAIFGRLLNVRLDQLPGSVGSLSAQMRSYETVRGFLSSTTLYLLVDVPFAIVFLALIAFIAKPIVALIPVIFIIMSIALGFFIQSRSDEIAAKGASIGNQKTGLLVEAIEGAETIKSGSGGWHFLSKWIALNGVAISQEAELRRISETNAYLSGLLQQSCYIFIVCISAFLASQNEFTQGAIVACAILSGRAMGPISQIPVMVVQASHAKAGLSMLEAIYRLEVDNHGVERPVAPEELHGSFALENVRFSYPSSPQALVVPKLAIAAGEKVGVIGPVGAGKSTLLRVLSGMYQPSEGRVRLDNYDIDQISRQAVSEKISYLQQENRLFKGTLRENILVGLADPGDTALRKAAERTGLLDVVANHPRGLDLPIAEGGTGLSGGQKQLVAFTRLLVSRPEILLLDEPTASMDATTEERCVNLLIEYVRPEHTLVLVTHKLALLPRLVDRIIVIANHQIVLDAPREAALSWLASLTPNVAA